MDKPPESTHLPFPENLLQRMEPQPNGCIHFTGRITAKGYGELASPHGNSAHRAAFGHFVGPIPEGHQIDHECHNSDESCRGGPTCLHRRCVNPVHLVAKPPLDNYLASPNTNANKTHCKWGHEFTDENTYRRKDNGGRGRKCRTCIRERQAGLRPAP